MKCISCEKWSFKIICKTCQTTLLVPSFNKRELSKDFFVYSFYNYEDIEDFLLSKYYFHGDRVFNILANLSFKKFSQNFEFEENVFALSIDDHTRHDFSQTAILSKALNSKHIRPYFNQLKASNLVKYAGRDLDFRQKNPRRFKYSGLKNQTIILVDDLVTTGTTLLEAKKVCEKAGCTVLFALTLADVKV